MERIWAKGHIILFDIDVKGGVNLKKLYGNKAMAVFIQPPGLKVLEERLRNRGTDTEAAIETRIHKAIEEMTYAPDFDKVIVNDKLEDSFAQAEKIVTDSYSGIPVVELSPKVNKNFNYIYKRILRSMIISNIAAKLVHLK